MINKDDIIITLSKWKKNELSKEQVKRWAENIVDNNIDILPEYDFDRLIEVLRYLENLDMNLVIKDDIDNCINFLQSKKNLKQATKEWESYLAKIDYDYRRLTLRNDPFYEKYC
jgi:hypothetical protein